MEFRVKIRSNMPRRQSKRQAKATLADGEALEDEVDQHINARTVGLVDGKRCSMLCMVDSGNSCETPLSNTNCIEL